MHRVKKTLTVIIASVVLIVPTVNAAEALKLNQYAPDWTLKRPDGKSVNFYDDSSGTVSVVLFWATWCPYCRALMPKLEELAQQYEQRPVRFYALNIWEDSDPLAHVRKYGYSFQLLLDADPVADDYGVQGTPGLLVVDQEHRVVYTRVKGTSEDDAKHNVALAIESALPAGQ